MHTHSHSLTGPHENTQWTHSFVFIKIPQGKFRHYSLLEQEKTHKHEGDKGNLPLTSRGQAQNTVLQKHLNDHHHLSPPPAPCPSLSSQNCKEKRNKKEEKKNLQDYQSSARPVKHISAVSNFPVYFKHFFSQTPTWASLIR